MKNVSKDTVIRTIVLVVTLANTLLTAFGKNPLPFSETEIYQAVSAICTVAATVWAWWKNNSFTSAAIKADEYMHQLKAEAKEEKVNANEESTGTKEDELR